MFACQVPLFASLSPSQKSQLCTALRPLHVKAGTAIVRAGDAGNTFYVVEAGTCTVHSTQGKVSCCLSLYQAWLALVPYAICRRIIDINLQSCQVLL